MGRCAYDAEPRTQSAGRRVRHEAESATGPSPSGGEPRPSSAKGPSVRVVSLVPSLTEAVAVTAPGLLVGVTDWCTHPADLTAARIGGTKNPDVAAIAALAPTS